MNITVSTKGQIVIPAEIRRRNHLIPGTKLVVVDMGDHIVLMPEHEDPVAYARGLFGRLGVKYSTDDLIGERREEHARDRAVEE